MTFGEELIEKAQPERFVTSDFRASLGSDIVLRECSGTDELQRLDLDRAAEWRRGAFVSATAS